MEQTIVGIWRRVLNVSQVGLNDNFFDLGGHSLLTVQVHRELKTVVDKPIAITDMFRFPTIRSLVAYLDEGKNGENGGSRNGRCQIHRSRRRPSGSHAKPGTRPSLKGT
ncbi:MAG: phosphopantetheine-binding protein [Chloroflexi bacterium]|nr:phosphopantetheine-binding protein [Chloroflexota bacterium]